MNSRLLKFEPMLYGLALILALLFRFVNLGVITLNDYEAGWALQSLDSLKNQQTLIGSQPFYVQVTTFLFFLFGPSNATARLLPVLLGSLMVFLPAIFRRWLGPGPALILAFFLAIDPGLVGLSRQVGTPILAMATGMLAVGSWVKRKPALAGLLLGMALMSGESFWAGLVGWGIAVSLGWKAGWFTSDDTSQNDPPVKETPFLRMAIFALGTLIVLGGLFFLRTRGLNGVISGLLAYLQGWGKPSEVSATSLIIALFAYQPLAVLFGVIGGIRGWRSHHNFDRFLSLWTFLALILAVVYPAHQVSDLVWTLLPLWALAARELHQHLKMPAEGFAPTLGQAVLVVVIWVFCALQLSALSDPNLPPEKQQVLLFSIIGGAFFLVITTLLVSWGWSRPVAVRGFLWGASTFLLLYTVSAMISAANLRPEPSAELWDRDARITQGTLLIKSLEDLSRWNKGLEHSLDIIVAGYPSPSLRWALRNFPNTKFLDQLAVGLNPSVVITSQPRPELAAAYRGQGLVWSQIPQWSLILPSEYIPWVMYHTAPVQKNSIYLWVRTDIFPGGTFTLPETQSP
jgi:hypothetical protein